MILQDYIYLDHEELYNPKENIKNRLVKMCNHKCSPKTGIIHRFLNIHKINSYKFNPKGDKIICDVLYNVDNYIPQKNDVIEAKVINVLPEKVMLIYPIDNPKMNIMSSYSGCNPSINEILSVKLNDIKYNKTTILCLGDLI